MKNTVLWYKAGFAPYYYVVRLFSDNEYTGKGAFLESWKEVQEYCMYYKAVDLVHVTEE